MSPTGRGMDELADAAENETNQALADQELKLLAGTAIDWEKLRPQVADQQTYDALIAAVKASTSQNENLAQLKSRIASLGSEGLAVARKVLSLV